MEYQNMKLHEKRGSIIIKISEVILFVSSTTYIIGENSL